MATPETLREPCPDRILDDIGGGFAIGAVGGSVFHFIKGIYNSPSGYRFTGGTQAVRMNVPRIGGAFAAWGGLFSALDCTMVYVRQKEDPWNSILAGTATGGLLSMRQGLRASARSAALLGVFFALFHGVEITLNKIEEIKREQARGMQGFGEVPESGAEGGWWFGGWFGGKKEEEGVKTEILESFDVPSFECK